MLSKEQHKNNLKDFRKSFIENIHQLRQERGLSLEELAEQSKVPQAELDKILSGNLQNWGAIFQLIRFLDRRINILLN
ncbi:MAG: helix-turn-helix domain-containing protein [Alphaproteobacteria bacterium]